MCPSTASRFPGRVGEGAVVEAGQQVGRVPVDDAGSRVLQVPPRDPAAEQSDADDAGPRGGRHVPHGVADEDGVERGRSGELQGVVHGIRGRFPRADVVGARGRGDHVVGADGFPQGGELGVARGRHQDDSPAPAVELAQQFGGAVESGQPVEVGGVQGVVRRGEPFVPARVAALPQEVAEEVLPRQSDGAVDVVHRHGVACLPKRLPPARDVQVVGVGEGSVDVEQSGAGHPFASVRSMAGSRRNTPTAPLRTAPTRCAPAHASRPTACSSARRPGPAGTRPGVSAAPDGLGACRPGRECLPGRAGRAGADEGGPP